VSNGHDDPLALSRAVFRDAVLRDDALAAARAAARLRAHDPDLGARDLEAVRASRQMLGRAIRAARARRVIGSLCRVCVSQSPWGLCHSLPRHGRQLLRRSA